MEIEYTQVNSLEEIASDALMRIEADNYKINFLLSYELTINDLIQNPLLDTQEKAQQWAADTCPENLYFNHGQYKVGGVDNIINELKEKPSSNRALYSLIDQKTILDSGDNPIPSFMLFQSILDDGVLYCNVYFRALEVSNFLRINLEEIRLDIEKISQSTLSFSTVRLVIFACRAHHVPNFNSLEKPNLDLLSQYQILKMLNDDKASFIRNIEKMAEIQTVLSSKSIKHIQEIVEGEWKGNNKERIVSILRDTSIKIDRLADLRKYHSHDNSVNILSGQISENLRTLAMEFSK
ncbi:hypothetical protein PPO02_07310 [Proteus mirabilis]|uniref:hypothetical protein n=1 Tax=Proteus mirabilis TaxID=584 RepID=UPI0016285B91|nr:hypothetical protein [Proteus mirabilis]EKU2369659.1 hypothetical protein [Proteus mirabilis]EKU7917588.1 hypothetical protein [Proteus mirabilis]EKU7921715.1 hypothetical protein [Proteus mirabilis]EKU8688631.1 hypothetical protein [Proteus mirabilis]EKU8703461.1 hypothetical protein [Proteus mirabilis]